MTARTAVLRRTEPSAGITPEGRDIASLVFNGELVRAPATVMAGGIFLLFAGPFLLNALVAPAVAAHILQLGMWLLVSLYVFITVLFVRQLTVDPKALWDHSLDHFAIGTWVAGTNVLARVIQPAAPLAGKGLTVLGWILAAAYVGWIASIIGQRSVLKRANGVIFLTTVALQSVVLTAVGFAANPSPELLKLLLGLNIFGVLIYAFWLWVLCAQGVNRQIAAWTPVNNITHGALSISVLAGETLVASMTSPPPVFLFIIQLLWVTAAALFVTIFLTETGLIASGRKLWAFRVANYARNFTYGMFFACTYYGVTRFPRSLMATLVSRPLLLLLAVLVAAVNSWEFGRHFALVARSAMAPWLRVTRG